MQPQTAPTEWMWLSRATDLRYSNSIDFCLTDKTSTSMHILPRYATSNGFVTLLIRIKFQKVYARSCFTGLNAKEPCSSAFASLRISNNAKKARALPICSPHLQKHALLTLDRHNGVKLNGVEEIGVESIDWQSFMQCLGFGKG